MLLGLYMNVLKSSVFSNILFLSACVGGDSIEPTPRVVQSPIPTAVLNGRMPALIFTRIKVRPRLPAQPKCANLFTKPALRNDGTMKPH
jgi:hypothetical protein